VGTLARWILWAGVWLISFVLITYLAYVGAEIAFPTPPPGPNGFRPGTGQARGFLILALALFGARFITNRIVAFRPREPRPTADTQVSE
jgi:hypothetical protein